MKLMYGFMQKHYPLQDMSSSHKGCLGGSNELVSYSSDIICTYFGFKKLKLTLRKQIDL
jgi:hypothetical protein